MIVTVLLHSRHLRGSRMLLQRGLGGGVREDLYMRTYRREVPGKR